MKTTLFSLPLAALLLLGIATTTLAQTTEALVISSTTLDQKGKPTTSKAYLKGDKMMVETGDEKQKQIMLFDADKEAMYIINHKKKEYTEMTKEDMEALSAMMQQQFAVMEQQLEMLPEKQREMVRKQMAAAMGTGQKPAEFSLEEKGVQVKEWKADKYVGKSDQQKQSEIYIASYSALGQEAKDFEALGKFFDLMKEYMQGMTKNMPSMSLGFFSENMPGYKEGIPVKTVMYNNKQEPISTTMLDSIGKEEVSKESFSVPEKYKKQKLTDMAQME